jgi:polyhydroxyalkanoate synthase
VDLPLLQRFQPCKLHLLLDSAVMLLLTSGGHNIGIVSEPGRYDRRYRLREKSEWDHHLDAHAWTCDTPVQQGPRWPARVSSVAARSGTLVSPSAVGGRGLKPLADAPGAYVLEP